MDINILTEIIGAYKNDFARISNEELYKWQAVHTYKKHWDINSRDFPNMLHNALDDTRNLMSSTNYYPRRMINTYAGLEPNLVKNAFIELFDEDKDLISRIKVFQQVIKIIHDRHITDERVPYQDDRAVMVYLALEYPERYYFYKYTMFKDFVEQVAYPYNPKAGSPENILHFLNVCNIVRGEIEKDDELISMHLNRLGLSEYPDNHLHILTQDIIYAAVQHLLAPNKGVTLPVNVTVDSDEYIAINLEPSLQGAFINHIQNAERNKRIGDLGELFAMEWEEKRLRSVGATKPRVAHDSKNIGDGLGYDISSYSDDRLVRYIEVKTTTGDITQPFFITASELKMSQDEARRFYLYRVFNYKPETKTGEVKLIQGDLSQYCISPTVYQVKLKKVE